MNDKYLRERPFLLIKILRMPWKTRGINRVRTERKDWMNQLGNITVEEVPLVVDRVSVRHIAEYSVIIDVLDRRVIRNNAVDMKDEAAIVDHFCGKYDNVVSAALLKWSLRGDNPNEILKRQQRILAYLKN